MYTGLVILGGQKYTAEPLVSEPRTFEFDMVTEKLKRHMSSGIDQIPAKLIKAGRRTLLSEIHKLIYSRNCLRSRRSPSLYLFIRRAIKQYCSNYTDI